MNSAKLDQKYAVFCICYNLSILHRNPLSKRILNSRFKAYINGKNVVAEFNNKVILEITPPFNVKDYEFVVKCVSNLIKTECGTYSEYESESFFWADERLEEIDNLVMEKSDVR